MVASMVSAFSFGGAVYLILTPSSSPLIVSFCVVTGVLTALLAINER